MNYNPSTLARIGDIHEGIRVDSGVLANGTYLAETQIEDFNIYGRVKLLQLFFETVVTVDADKATLFQYTYSCTALSVTSFKLGLVSLSIAGLAVGGRCTWVGGAVGDSNHLVTGGPGYTDLMSNTPAVVGYEGGTGTIGHLTTVASQVTGTHKHSLFYVPMSDGAYVTAVR